MEADLEANIIVVPNLHIEVFDEDGDLVDVVEARNMVVNSGLRQLRNLIGFPFVSLTGSSPVYYAVGTPNFFAVGSDATTTSAGMTALGTEIYRKEIIQRVTESDGRIYLYQRIQTTEGNGGGTAYYREAGLFSYYSGCDLWCRATFNTITKSSSLAVNFSWRLTFAAA